ncbi:MAG: hypothetical protein QW040_00090 [Candidatus Aenigmatarchaeota archaeon]
MRVEVKFFLLALIFFFLVFKSVSFSEGIDPTSQFNQTSSTNITGNASTIDQATIDSYLNFNGDGLTWDVTEAQVGTNYTYPVANQNFTSGAYGWTYGEENDVNNMATGAWDPDSGRIDPGSYNFSIVDTSATLIAQVNQYINYSFTVDNTADLVSATAYASFRLTCTDDQLVYAKLNLILPNGEVSNLWTSQTWQTTNPLDTGWLNVSVNVLSNFTSKGIGTYQLSLMIHTETDDAGKNAQKTTCYHYLDDAGVELSYPEYQISIEHNATISYSGSLNSINVSVNFTSTVDDVYQLYIYNFTDSTWDSNPCESQVAIANTYYTKWCNVTINPQNYISENKVVRVRLNSTVDSDKGTLKEEYVQFYVGYSVGYLEVRLVLPSTETINNVIQNSSFLVNATVFCRNAPCGNIYGTLLYNLSSSYPDTPINTSYGDKPFFVNESPAYAIKPCPNNPLNANDFCNLTWVVNASGEISTDWKIGVYFNSSYTEVQPNSTSNATLSIVSCTVDFSLSWSSIDFGELLPNTHNNSAPGNANNVYNITVNPGSCNLDLYIRGTDLINSTFGSVIKVGNISWSNISSNLQDGYFQLTETNSVIKLNVPEKTNITTWYWLSVPPVYAGFYTGTIYIMGVKHE